MSLGKRVFLSALAVPLLCAAAFCRMSSGGNGSISLEADDPEKAYQGVLQAAGKHGAVVSSYNTSKNQETGRTAVSAQFAVDKDKVAAFMAEAAAQGKVKSQNYYERNTGGGQAENFQAQVDALDREIAALGSMASRIPTIMGLAVQHRQTLASQVQLVAISVGGEVKVAVSLSIQETGTFAAATSLGGKGARGPQVPLPWALFSAALTAFLASWMGFLFGRLRPGAVEKQI